MFDVSRLREAVVDKFNDAADPPKGTHSALTPAEAGRRFASCSSDSQNSEARHPETDVVVTERRHAEVPKG